MIEVISPAGFENFFHELSELLSGGAPGNSDIRALGVDYGVQFGELEWLPNAISRYGLPPPADALHGASGHTSRRLVRASLRCLRHSCRGSRHLSGSPM